MAKASLTGGTEIMSALPFLVRNVRFGTTLGSGYVMEDHIQRQFLDTYTGLTLQKMAEDVANKHQVNRKEADQFALESHLKWKAGDRINLDNLPMSYQKSLRVLSKRVSQ